MPLAGGEVRRATFGHGGDALFPISCRLQTGLFDSFVIGRGLHSIGKALT